ncbi:MAG: ABC transporter permease [Anaerolineaceae bacterium]|nr:ABC transporter permease [Anaerolineaceae bacterium]
MFFKQVQHNATKNRKDNALLYGSLVVAIVAFYTLLSLGDQDVMRFLQTFESDAIQKLMNLIPIVYAVSLFFVFFLVYFAYRYQLENRQKEFGLYLMLGMKRSKLFAMLMSETIWNSLVSILIGFPIALLLTELVSLTTARIAGLGIIGHRFTLSIPAIIGTVLGFLAVQIFAMLILSIDFTRREPVELLRSDTAEKQTVSKPKFAWLSFVLGLLMLGTAYYLGVNALRTFDFLIILLVLIIGALGTFLLFRGLGVFIGAYIRRKALDKTGIFVFTGRQLQENVLGQHRSLAIASLLMLVALAAVSYGVGTMAIQSGNTVRSVDFALVPEEEKGGSEAVLEFLHSEKAQKLIGKSYPMKLDQISYTIIDRDENADVTDGFSWDGLLSAMKKLPETEDKENMINRFSSDHTPYLIALSSYNALLGSIGEAEIQLNENQAAMFSAMSGMDGFVPIMQEALKLGAYVEIDKQKLELKPQLYTYNVVADRAITIFAGLILTDENYEKYASDPEDIFSWNIMLKDDLVEDMGLMQVILQMQELLQDTDLRYDTFLSGIGRNLFITVASSYLTIYLGVLFMVIANTVIGLKYLMQERRNKSRYQTMLMLGSNIEDLSKSARTQIRTFFALGLGVALISAVFAIWAMFTSFLRLPAGASVTNLILFTGIAAALFVLVEWIYIHFVEQASNREIQALQVNEEG